MSTVPGRVITVRFVSDVIVILAFATEYLITNDKTTIISSLEASICNLWLGLGLVWFRSSRATC